MDRNGLGGVMDILVNIASCLKAIEQGMEGLRSNRAVTKPQSLSTTQQGGCTAHGWEQSQGQPQLPPQEADLSEAVWEKVAHCMRQLPINHH